MFHVPLLLAEIHRIERYKNNFIPKMRLIANTVSNRTIYSPFQLTFHCNIPNFVPKFVAKFKSSFQNSQAGL